MHMKKWGILAIMIVVVGLNGCNRREEMGTKNTIENEVVTWGEDETEDGRKQRTFAVTLREINETYNIVDIYGVFDNVFSFVATEESDIWIYVDADTGNIINQMELDYLPYKEVYSYENYMVIQQEEVAYIVNRQGELEQIVNMAEEVGVTEDIFLCNFCIMPETDTIYYSTHEENAVILYSWNRSKRKREELLHLKKDDRDWINNFNQLRMSYSGKTLLFTGGYFKQGDKNGYPCYGYMDLTSGEVQVYQEERYNLKISEKGAIFYEGLDIESSSTTGTVTIIEDGENQVIYTLENQADSAEIIPCLGSSAFYCMVVDDVQKTSTLKRYRWETGKLEETYSLPYVLKNTVATEDIVLYQYAEWNNENDCWQFHIDYIRLDEMNENPFDLDELEKEGQAVSYAYGFGMVAMDFVDISHRMIDYSGGELCLKFGFNNEAADCQVGIVVFIDGIAQKYSMQPKENKTYMQTYELTGIGKQYVDIYLTPEFGLQGDKHYVTFASMLEPLYIPEVAEMGYGYFHNLAVNLPCIINYPVKSAPIEIDSSEYEVVEKEKREGITGKLYQNGEETLCIALDDSATTVQLEVNCKGYIDEIFRMSAWINGEPAAVFNEKYYIDVPVGEGKKSVMDLTFEKNMTEWKDINSLDLFFVPITNQNSTYGPLMEKISTINIVKK